MKFNAAEVKLAKEIDRLIAAAAKHEHADRILEQAEPEMLATLLELATQEKLTALEARVKLAQAGR